MSYLRELLARAFKLCPPGLLWRGVWLASPKFNLGVVGILFDEQGRVLLLEHVFRRSYPWGLPAGWVNPGEAVDTALARELHEECGLRCTELRLASVESGHKRRVQVVLAGKAHQGPLTTAHFEIRSAQFFEPSALPTSTLPAHAEHIRRAAAALAAGEDRSWLYVPPTTPT